MTCIHLTCNNYDAASNKKYVFFSSPGPKSQMSFSHHLASVVCKLLQKSSPLKLLGQISPNLATIIIRVSSLKNVSNDPANQLRWPPWLKIEHRGKM